MWLHLSQSWWDDIFDWRRRSLKFHSIQVCEFSSFPDTITVKLSILLRIKYWSVNIALQLAWSHHIYFWSIKKKQTQKDCFIEMSSPQPWKTPAEGAGNLLRAFFLNVHKRSSCSKSSEVLVTSYVVPQHRLIRCVLFRNMENHKMSWFNPYKLCAEHLSAPVNSWGLEWVL